MSWLQNHYCNNVIASPDINRDEAISLRSAKIASLLMLLAMTVLDFCNLLYLTF